MSLAPAAASAQSLQALNDATKGPIEAAAGPKVFMTDQARLTFQAAWKEFRDTHTYTLDGEFEPGSGCPDDQATLDSFYIHLGSHRLTKTIHFMQRCSLCAGSGKVQTATDGNIGNNNCPNCHGSGREAAANTYTFYVLPANLPAKPETPRLIQERALMEKVSKELAELELLHAAGNVEASLQLGKIFSQGYHFIPKDIPRSEPYFLRAMSLGSETGLIGYLAAREAAFNGKDNEAILLYALRIAHQRLSSGSNAKPSIAISYTDHLVAQGIAERILKLLAKSCLSADDLKISKLRDIARSPNGVEPIANARTPAINPIIREFLSNERPPRITGNSYRNLRQAAITKANGAFGMLADFIQNGEVTTSLRNAQAAHIYYKLEYLTSGDSYALECARSIEVSIDLKTTDFFVDEYRRLMAESSVNDNALMAVDEIHPLIELAK